MTPHIVALVSRVRLARDIHELKFSRPRELTLMPGQHIRFHHQGRVRDYTPVGGDDQGTFSICIRRGEDHGFSARLAQSTPGETFEVSGPYGHFIYRPAADPAVWVGTGTGVAPFAAFARAGVRGYTLIQGARCRRELLYRELLEQNSGVYIPCLSRDTDAGFAFRGRVTDYLSRGLSPGRYHFYICGSGAMVQDAVEIIDDRFADSLVFTERFN